jgi:hypothetical protein
VLTGGVREEAAVADGEDRERRGLPDDMPTRIGQVIMLLHGGDREEARSRFAALWHELDDDGSPLHRCTLAHYMADSQDDPEEELAWDLKALAAADALDRDQDPDALPGRVRWGRDTVPVRGLYPSLHLNLAADYYRLGEYGMARGHLGRARGACDALADDDYGNGIRAAIGRLDLRLAEAMP